MTAAADERGADETFFERPPRVDETPRLLALAADELRRQRRRRDDAALRAADGERGEHVLQLAYVAGPVVARKRRERRASERRAPVEARRRLPPEMLRQHHDVLAPIAQRRHA